MTNLKTKQNKEPKKFTLKETAFSRGNCRSYLIENLTLAELNNYFRYTLDGFEAKNISSLISRVNRAYSKSNAYCHRYQYISLIEQK